MTERALIELNPHFVAGGDISVPSGTCGFSFECPVCVDRPHHVAVFWDKGGHQYRNVWMVSHRDDWNRITVSPSVLADVNGVCSFHGWIQEGIVKW